MRAFSLFQGRAYADAIAAATGPYASRPSQVGPLSPLSDQSALQAVVWADLGVDPSTIALTRESVIAIPAVARQRHLLCGAAAGCPLRVLTGDQLVTEQPRWTSRTDGPVSPWHRMLWTVDDLMFEGWSLWRAVRGPGAELLTADRIPPWRWDEDEHTGALLVDGEPVAADEVILIPGPHEGILNFGGPALTRTIDNLEAAAMAARNPSAYLELHYTGDDDLTDVEIDQHIARWAAARKGLNGGVAWTNKVLEVKEHGTHEAHLLIEGRNADAVDVSRLVSSPAAMADATNAGASLTYETTDGRNGQFLDYGAKLYMDAIAARLSMDDVVPEGQRTAFDTAQLRQLGAPATGAPTND